MRKGIVFLLITILLYLSNTPETVSSEPKELIPDEAIRLRILANSDTKEDQRIKLKVRDDVNEYITELVQTIDDIDEARRLIDEHVPEIEKIVASTLDEENQELTYSVDYREDVSFPDKIYGNYLYPAGEYEAVLITLGEGLGENWWCVLFPPLCFLDFSEDDTTVAETKEEAEDDHSEEEVEVRFFLLDWLGLS